MFGLCNINWLVYAASCLCLCSHSRNEVIWIQFRTYSLTASRSSAVHHITWTNPSKYEPIEFGQNIETIFSRAVSVKRATKATWMSLSPNADTYKHITSVQCWPRTRSARHLLVLREKPFHFSPLSSYAPQLFPSTIVILALHKLVSYADAFYRFGTCDILYHIWYGYAASKFPVRAACSEFAFFFASHVVIYK